MSTSNGNVESTDDGYGEAIGRILFGKAPWYTRYGASLVAVIFAIAVGASLLASYSVASRAALSFRVEDDDTIVGRARVPQSLVTGLDAGQTLALTLGEPDSQTKLRVNVSIRRIAESTPDDRATVELIFPRELSEANLLLSERQWTIDLHEDKRLFEILLK